MMEGPSPWTSPTPDIPAINRPEGTLRLLFIASLDPTSILTLLFKGTAVLSFAEMLDSTKSKTVDMPNRSIILLLSLPPAYY